MFFLLEVVWFCWKRGVGFSNWKGFGIFGGGFVRRASFETSNSLVSKRIKNQPVVRKTSIPGGTYFWYLVLVFKPPNGLQTTRKTQVDRLKEIIQQAKTLKTTDQTPSTEAVSIDTSNFRNSKQVIAKLLPVRAAWQWCARLVLWHQKRRKNQVFIHPMCSSVGLFCGGVCLVAFSCLFRGFLLLASSPGPKACPLAGGKFSKLWIWGLRGVFCTREIWR